MISQSIQESQDRILRLEKDVNRQVIVESSDQLFVTLNYLHSLQNMTEEIANLVNLVRSLQTEIVSRRSTGRVRWALRRVMSEAELTRYSISVRWPYMFYYLQNAPPLFSTYSRGSQLVFSFMALFFDLAEL